MNKHNENDDILTTGLFFKIWRNCYINKVIMNKLRICNLYRHKRVISNVNDLAENVAQHYSWVELENIDGNEDNDAHIMELINNLPVSVTRLEFGINTFREPIDLVSLLPSNITSLKFGKSEFGCPIKCNSIPSTLKSLTIDTFDHLSSSSGEGLTYLEIGEFAATLPRNLKTFKCKSNSFKPFNIDLLLPAVNTITCLDFSGSCSAFVNFNLPSSFSKLLNLKSLNMGNHFKSRIKKGTLPNGLKTLILSSDYNVKNGLTIGSIPSSVISLKFKSIYPISVISHPLDWDQQSKIKLTKLSTKKLPLSLTNLQVGRDHYLSISSSKFSGGIKGCSKLNKIIFTGIGYYKSEIPKSTMKLKFIGFRHQPASYIANVPGNIQSISIDGNFRFNLVQEINNITNLKIVNQDFQDATIMLDMSKLTSLKCECDHLNNVQIKQLQSLQSLSIDGYIPKTYIQSITILELLLPIPLIDTNKLPCSLHTLIIGCMSNIKLPISPNIKSIFVPSNNFELIDNLYNNHHYNNLFDIIKIFDDKSIFNKLSIKK